jgi:hypothetical protein
MSMKLLLGIAIFLVGLSTAIFGMVRVGTSVGPNVKDTADYNAGSLEQTFDKVALPAFAGLSLAVGGFLIGLSMGNWKHPRAHVEPGDEIVDPEGYHKMKHV